MNLEPKLDDSTVLWVSTFCGNIQVPWILSAFCGNIHVPWILSVRILPRLATPTVIDKVHCLHHCNIHCSTVIPTVSTRSPQRAFISVDALRSRGYWHLLMVHLTLRTHIYKIESYPHLGTCQWLLYILPVSWDFSMCLSYYLILRTFQYVNMSRRRSRLGPGSTLAHLSYYLIIRIFQYVNMSS